MHEWALADAVLFTAEKAAKNEKLISVSEIIISLGELQQVDEKNFRFSLEKVKKNGHPLLSGAGIKIVNEPVKFRCRVCGAFRTLDDVRKRAGAQEAEFIHFVPEMAHVYLKCESCSSPDFDITSGRGVYIKSIEGEKE